VVNGKLTYTDSIKVQGHNKAVLDSAAKKWINSYFKYHWADTVSKHQDAKSSVLSWGILEFRAPPNSMRVVYYSYYLWVTIKIPTHVSDPRAIFLIKLLFIQPTLIG
jgi:hypothetical protein